MPAAPQMVRPTVPPEAWEFGRQLLTSIGTRWASLLICSLSSGPRGYGELHRAVNGISRKMLTATLRGLEADGLVVRSATATPSGRVLYSLSHVGQTLVGPLDEVFRWGQAHHTQVEESRLANGRTGHGVRPKVRG